jgi:prolyl-tRNA editing enzyme YbaK/EbsC (Cys-tRNA(Pro) deacylase)
MDWPEPVERSARCSERLGAEARVEEFAEGTPTAEDAANAVGCDLSQIVKSLVFDCDGRAVLVMVRATAAPTRPVAAAVGAEKARVAGAELVVEATGYPPGGVAPFGLRA